MNLRTQTVVFVLDSESEKGIEDDERLVKVFMSEKNVFRDV